MPKHSQMFWAIYRPDWGVFCGTYPRRVDAIASFASSRTAGLDVQWPEGRNGRYLSRRQKDAWASLRKEGFRAVKVRVEVI